MKRTLAVVAGVLASAMTLNARADYLCCNMNAPGSACSWSASTATPVTANTLTAACQPGTYDTNEWIVAIATTNHQGGVTVGARKTSAPWDELCMTKGLNNLALDFCVPLTASGGVAFPAAGPVGNFGQMGPPNYVTISGLGARRDADGSTNSRNLERCYQGPRKVLTLTPPPGANYSCTPPASWVPMGGVGFDTPAFLADVFLPDVQTPPVLGSAPILTGPSMATVGTTPVYNVTAGTPNSTVFLTSTFAGAIVQDFAPVGTTDPDGNLVFDGSPWVAANVGPWSDSAIIASVSTPADAFTVAPAPPVPAVAPPVLMAAALGIGGFAVRRFRKRA